MKCPYAIMCRVSAFIWCMTTHPCAKINLGLNVVGRRADGYHDIETILYPIPLCDMLEIEPADIDSFSMSGLPLTGNVESNIVLKAIKLLRDKGYSVPPLRVRLQKNIPSGAGLGGGSSDAAFTVKMLNKMFWLGLSIEEMKRMVSTLGADCAFFIEAKPAFAEGIGDRLSPISIDLSGLFLVLIKPHEEVSTKEAYARITPCIPPLRLKEAVQGDITTWRNTVLNDFEKSIFALHPKTGILKRKLYWHNAIYASMSGSGSSVYGLFCKPENVETHYFKYTSPL